MYWLGSVDELEKVDYLYANDILLKCTHWIWKSINLAFLLAILFF